MTNLKKDEPTDGVEFETEIDTDSPELEDVETSSKNKIKQLQSKLKECETAKRSHLEEAQRAKAEFLNARKRLETQKNSEVERETDKFILKLLPLCDSFTMAMSNAAVWESVDENWRKGIEAIYGQLQSILTAYDVTAHDPTGEVFDHELHEALGSEESDQPTDTVIKVVQLGYSRNDHIIRPAKVLLSN